MSAYRKIVFQAFILTICTGGLLATARAQNYDCIELKCGQMKMCAEASYKLEVCNHHRRDRDNDGIPCEKLCGKSLETYRGRVRAQAGRYPLPTMDGVANEQTTKDRVAPAGLGLISPASQQFLCAGKSRCREMLSCAEARFYLNQCGVKTLDGNRDGVPCNSLCR